jgi:hypothetical protein
MGLLRENVCARLLEYFLFITFLKNSLNKFVYPNGFFYRRKSYGLVDGLVEGLLVDGMLIVNW